MAVETIGKKLREARLNKKISLDELQQITKVQKRYLEAIETDDFESLPGKFYVRAFIRQYAQAVGEDGEKLVAVYDGKETLGGSEISSVPEPETIKGSRKAMHQEDEGMSKFWTSLPTILLALVALAIIIVVGYMTWQDRQSSPIIGGESSSVKVEGSVPETASSSQQTAQSSTSSSTEKSEEKKTDMEVKPGADTGQDLAVSVTNAKNPITIEFTAKERCWVGVLVNGAYTYQYTLAAGEKQSTALPDNIGAATITLGAAGSADVTANGQAIPVQPGDNGLNPKNLNLDIKYQQ